MRNLRYSLCAVVVALSLSPANIAVISAADDFFGPRIGGNGGGRWIDRCPPGQFVVGLAGRAGLWVDAMGIICAAWNPSTQILGGPIVHQFHGGTGGAQTTVMCPSNSIVSGWEIRPTRSDEQMVEYVAPECRGPLPPRDVVRVGRIQFGQKAGPPSSGAFRQEEVWYGCPPNQLVVGIHGASGAYLDRVGLVCGDAPVRILRPLGKQRNP